MGLFGFLKKKKDDTGSVMPNSALPTDTISTDINGPAPPTQTPPAPGSAPTEPPTSTPPPIPPAQ